MNYEINDFLYDEQIFQKNFVSLSPAQVQILFVHSVEIYKSLIDMDGVVVPKPLSFSGTLIRYNMHNLGASLFSLIKDEGFCFLVKKSARILKQIHTVKGLLHSDYVLHNIFIENDTVYVIDSNPPALLEFSRKLIYGVPVYDVFSFIHSIIETHGLKKTLLNPSCFFNSAKIFLNEYGYCFRTKDIFHVIRYMNTKKLFKDRIPLNKNITRINLVVTFLLMILALVRPRQNASS